MSDEVPSPDKAVYLLFEFVALGFILEAIGALRQGKPLLCLALMLPSPLFLWMGIYWFKISAKIVPIIKTHWLRVLVRLAVMTPLAIALVWLGHNALTPPPGLRLWIGGMVTMGINGNPDGTTGNSRLQLTVSVGNKGKPTHVHDWNLWIKTSHGDLRGVHLIGQTPAKGSLNLQALDERFHQPIDTNDQVDGLIDFEFSVPQQKINQLQYDPTARLVISATDDFDKVQTGERNISEMAAERSETRPSK